jgi:hypothetical protein
MAYVTLFAMLIVIISSVSTEVNINLGVLSFAVQFKHAFMLIQFAVNAVLFRRIAKMHSGFLTRSLMGFLKVFALISIGLFTFQASYPILQTLSTDIQVFKAVVNIHLNGVDYFAKEKFNHPYAVAKVREFST